MNVIEKWTAALPPPDRDTVMRYARGKRGETTDALLDTVIREAAPTVEPRLCYTVCEVKKAANGVDFGVCFAPGHDLAAHLGGCRRAVLFAATVGIGADRLIARTERVSPAKALLADAFFTERVEALCDLFTARYNAPARRFSPGYGDLPLNFQKELCRVLDCPRQIGVTLTETLLMIPTKSVSAIVGIKE